MRYAANRHVYWIVGLVGALVLAGLEVGVLILGDDPVVPADRTSASAAPDDSRCRQRMGIIMMAIVRYAHDKGAPPRQLSDLGADYLGVPPTDPVTGQPYEYRVTGGSVSLTCPVPAADRPAGGDRRT
jgi:hypothetical protein